MLVPIERTSIFCATDETPSVCFGSKQPIALIVKSASGIHAYDLEVGRQLSISELKSRVPEIERFLRQNVES